VRTCSRPPHGRQPHGHALELARLARLRVPAVCCASGLSLPYASPEVLVEAKATSASDVYSFGVCLVELFFLKSAYDDIGDPRAFAAGVVSGTVRPQIPCKAAQCV
jgi:serine/threonine protein kinase